MENSRWLLIGFLGLVLILFLVKQLQQVSPAKARDLLASGALILDVRSPGEFAGGHLEGAVNLPLDEIRKRIAGIEPDQSRPILVCCLSGTRSAMACRTLHSFGYPEVHNLGSLRRARKLAE